MRKFSVIVIMVCFFAMLISFGMASAAEVLLKAKADTVSINLDKNGAEYVRIICTETKAIQGVEYEIGTPVMAFGTHVAEAKLLKNGDKFSAIVQKRTFEGRDSYTVLKWVSTGS